MPVYRRLQIEVTQGPDSLRCPVLSCTLLFSDAVTTALITSEVLSL